MKKNIFSALIAIGLIAPFVIAQNATQDQSRKKRSAAPGAQTPRRVPPYEEIAAAFKKYDRAGLRNSRRTEVVKSPAFLAVPAYYKDKKFQFTIAKEAPTVDFSLSTDLYPEISYDSQGRGGWSNWGDVTLGPNGRFYYGLGNHLKGSTGNYLYLMEYDPVARQQRKVVDVNRLVGVSSDEWTDTMLHGNMNFLPDGRLVAAGWLGHEGAANLPLQAVKTNWKGSYVFTYNVLTGVAESHGIPMKNGTWPTHSTDPHSGVLMAVGIGYAEGFPQPRWTNADRGGGAGSGQHLFMAYDVINKKLLWAGLPPGNIDLSERGVLIDDRTGIMYSTDGANDNTFVSYDQHTNRWRDLKCKVPVNPATKSRGNLRAYTYTTDRTGAFHCMSASGMHFKFYPQEERVETIGYNWGDEGFYVATTAVSPRKRFVYYVPDAEGHTLACEQPVVQYDTETGTRKVIAFLSPVLFEKFGYVSRGTYGIELNEDGSMLVVLLNGTFGPELHRGISPLSMTHPAIVAIHIPQSERVE